MAYGHWSIFTLAKVKIDHGPHFAKMWPCTKKIKNCKKCIAKFDLWLIFTLARIKMKIYQIFPFLVRPTDRPSSCSLFFLLRQTSKIVMSPSTVNPFISIRAHKKDNAKFYHSKPESLEKIAACRITDSTPNLLFLRL